MKVLMINSKQKLLKHTLNIPASMQNILCLSGSSVELHPMYKFRDFSAQLTPIIVPMFQLIFMHSVFF